MYNPKYFYEKYQEEFEQLEQFAKVLSGVANPIKYEYYVGEEYFFRNGKKPTWDTVVKGGQVLPVQSHEIAPPERKKKIDDYWNQRDKVDKLLEVDSSFQSYCRGRNMKGGPHGIDALFDANMMAIKHKIYLLWHEERERNLGSHEEE